MKLDWVLDEGTEVYHATLPDGRIADCGMDFVDDTYARVPAKDGNSPIVVKIQADVISSINTIEICMEMLERLLDMEEY